MDWKGKKVNSNFLIHGDNLRIFGEGTYLKKYSHFGGIDLVINAIKTLIHSMDFKFAEENDFDARDKIMMELIDCIGESIKYNLPYDTDLSNSELVAEFIGWNS